MQWLNCLHNMNTRSRNVIISGGMGGIGQAVAMRFAKEGHRVCVLYHNTPVDVAQAFAAGFGAGIAIKCDMSNTAEIALAVHEAHAQLGSLDICVHAAVSPLVRKRMQEISSEEFRGQFVVTTFGGLALFKEVLPYLKAQKSGHLVGITSAALDARGPSSMAGYLAAKFALRGILKDLRAELSPMIGVHEIAPPFVDTPLNSDLPPQVREFLAGRTPSQTPQEVADTIFKLVLP
jgi:NAD(P)-dependent dehydrogenase (short-subunit alcohol dehydrogenase family)